METNAKIGRARKLGQRIPSRIRVEGGVAFVELTRGMEAKIDAGDVPLVCDKRWSATAAGYARAAYTDSSGKTQMFLMHRVITGAPDGKDVDHADRDKLNNRRANLRVCEHYQNMGNYGPRANSKSGLRGVSFCKDTGRWRAIIKVNGTIYRLGRFDTKEAAAEAYKAKAIELLGEFAYSAKEAA